MSNPEQICFLPEPGDTYSFAHSVAINDKYMVVSDIVANRIVVYTKNSQGQWFREREIYPPEDSMPYKWRNCFGISLILGENALIVNDKTLTKVTKSSKRSVPYFIFQGQHLIRLDQPDTIPIKLPIEKKEDLVGCYILSEDEPKLIELPDNNQRFSYQILALGNFALSKNFLLVGVPSDRVDRPDSGKGWLFNLQALDSEVMELSSNK